MWHRDNIIESKDMMMLQEVEHSAMFCYIDLGLKPLCSHAFRGGGVCLLVFYRLCLGGLYA